jgi:hypothetical protein
LDITYPGMQADEIFTKFFSASMAAGTCGNGLCFALPVTVLIRLT